MTRTDDITEIVEVVRRYVEGMCRADGALLRQVMHERLACIGHFAGGLEWDTRDAFVAGVEQAVNLPDPAPWHVVRSLSVAGDIASVHVEDIWLGDRYDDLLTLLKHEGRWVIVSKVFHLRPGS
jgi:hypothetical protein